jgi:hypothetical protein
MPGLALLSTRLELDFFGIAKNISLATRLLTLSFVRKRWLLHRADQLTARQAVLLPPLMNWRSYVLGQVTRIRWCAFRGDQVLVLQLSFHVFV